MEHGEQPIREANEGKPANERFEAYVLARMETLGIDPERLTARDFFKILSDIYFLPAVDQDAPRDREAEYTATRRSEAIRPLLPFLLDEFEAAEDAGEIEAGATFEEVVREGFTDKGRPSKKSQFYEIIRRAQNRKMPEVVAIIYGRKIKPNLFVETDTILSKMIMSGKLSAGENAIPIDAKITTFVSLTDNTPKLNGTENVIMCAALSYLVQAENIGCIPVFTPDNIYKVIPGGGQSPRKEKREEIIKTIRDLMTKPITVDATQELAKHAKSPDLKNDLSDGSTFVMRDVILPVVEKCYTTSAGEQIIYWEFRGRPILLQHAEYLNRVRRTPLKYLQVPKMQTTDTNSKIILYLNERISMMEGEIKKARQNLYNHQRKKTEEKKTLADYLWKGWNAIRFNTLLKDSGLKNTDRRTEKKRIREACERVLDYWTEQGRIAGYEKPPEDQAAGKERRETYAGADTYSINFKACADS